MRSIQAVSPQKYVHLDFIRGCAAILVLLHHVRVTLFGYFEEFPADLQHIGTKAVIFLCGFNRGPVLVFFTLSGFLIMRKVLKTLEDWSWTSYAIDRLSRLWVVLVPALFATLFFVWLGRQIWTPYDGAMGFLVRESQMKLGVSSFFANLFFLQTIHADCYGDNLPLWSLAYEFWYYVLFPLAALAFVRKGYIKLCYLISFIALATWVFKYNSEVIWLFPCWLVGGLPLLIRKTQAELCEAFAKRHKVLTLAFSFSSLVAALAIHRILRSDSVTVDFGLCLCVAMFIAMTTLCPTSDAGTYTRLAQYLSARSYTLYVFHNSLLGILFYYFVAGEKVQPTIRNLLLAGLISILIFIYSDVAYRVFEKRTPFVRQLLRERFLARL